MYLETIKKSLKPRLENILKWKSDLEKVKIEESFLNHAVVINNFILNNEIFLENFSVEYFVELHKIFYPANHKIEAIWNDWKKSTMLPWDFRKQYLEKYITDFSSIENIKTDFENLLKNFILNKEKTRVDILKFYFDFWKVHPFWDSNWTISSLICDILCKKYGFKELNMLSIRFKDKNYLFEIIKSFEKDKNLEKCLKMIDDFNNPLVKK